MKITIKNQRLNKILKLIKKRAYSAKELQTELDVTGRTLYVYLKELSEKGDIKKFGKAPRVVYEYNINEYIEKNLDINLINTKSKYIKKNFVFEGETELHEGGYAFALWAKQSLKNKTSDEKVKMYEEIIKKVESTRKSNPFFIFSINEKIKEFVNKTGEKKYLENTFYIFTQTLPDFGRTKEYLYLTWAKQNDKNSEEYIKKIISDSLPYLTVFILKEKFDAIAFIPPSAQRKYQLMIEFKKRFKTIKKFSEMPIISIKKIHSDGIAKQQKHIKKDTERMSNVDKTIHIENTKVKYTKVLLIDDLVGSGATLNQTAKKFITQGIAKSVYGIGIIGQKSGYEVVKST